MDTSLAEPALAQPVLGGMATDPCPEAPADPPPEIPHAPFPHGPFLVETDGALHPLRPPALRFAWRGRRCEARIEDGQVRISALAGAVPYTAQRPDLRPSALAALAALPAELPPGWRLRIRPDHRLELEWQAGMAAPSTAIGLVARMVGFALVLDGYLDRLESAGIVPAGEVA